MINTTKITSTLRASYSIEPEVLLRFNELVRPGERSKTIENLIKNTLAEQERKITAIAEEFVSHPDFAQVRDDCDLWEKTTVADGLDNRHDD